MKTSNLFRLSNSFTKILVDEEADDLFSFKELLHFPNNTNI